MLSNKSDCWSAQKHKQILKETNKHLWRFVQKNSSVTSPEDIYLNLTKVSRSNLQMLCFIYFMLSEEVQEFIEETAPAILQRLSKTSLKEHKVFRGNVKGKINWNKTLTERYASGGDPSIFVCSQKSSVFDMPENRLLLFMLRKILYMSNSLSNIDFDKDKITLDEMSKKGKWIDIITKVGLQANKLLKNPYVRKIGDMHDLTQKTILQAEKTRGQMYTKLAKTAKIYYLMINSPITYLDKELKGKTLEPLNKDTLYEIAVLFKLLEVTRNSGWGEKSIGLIGGSSSVISRFTLDKKVMNIYFQGIPKEFALNSNYGPLMNTYGLSSKLRRPDIVLEVIESNKKNYYIIEVKRSEKRTYLVDGAYKLFGYLKDFEKVQNVKVNLYGVLVGWSNIKDLEEVTEKEVYISSWKSLEKTFTYIINKEMS